MTSLLNQTNLTLQELCRTLNLDTATITEPLPGFMQPPPPSSTTKTNNSENKAVVIIPYVLIAALIIIILIIDFTLYRRKHAYKYRRKLERGGHDFNRQFRKVRGAARVPMDPDHLVMFGSSETPTTTVETSVSFAHDQGHEYTDDDIGGLSAAVTAENSKAQLLARKARCASTPNEAERGMAAWQLKFGRQKSFDNDKSTPKRFMNVLSPKKA